MKNEGSERVNIDELLGELVKRWPSPVVSREKVGEFSGGLLCPKTMAKLDSMGLGPPKFYFGRKVAYPTVALVEWMRMRSRDEWGNSGVAA